MAGPLIPNDYEKLCQRARERLAHVELTVEPGRTLGVQGREYRMLERLRVRRDDTILAEQRIIGNRIGDAATRLLAII
jgi:hypothetical protein